MISIVLYGIAVLLVVFIIVSIARTHDIKPGDWIALLGIVVSIILAQHPFSPPQPDNATPTPILTAKTSPVTPISASTSIITTTPITTETLNWAISFEYRFPAGFWSVGTHQYTLESQCPNIDISGTHGGSITQTFEVSQSAALLPGDVYLRLSGLRDGPIEGNTIDKISPSQTTTAVWSLIETPQSDAELAGRDCTITVTWDGGIPKQLTPGLPFQR